MQPQSELPFISAKCITYGRVEMLEESLHSFLQQDYSGKKEMIIVNDYPEQKLMFNHPEVFIYNIDNTFTTIGEKENFAASKCKGELICQWDDDDVALPNHMSNVAKLFRPDAQLLHWKTGVFFNNRNITNIEWIGNSGIVYRKSVLEAIGGYPIENAGYDMTFVEKIHRKFPGKTIFAQLPNEEASWFYMWGGRGYHMSGQGHDKPGKMNAIQRHSMFIESLKSKGLIPTGIVNLKPNWKQDYKQLLKDYLAS